MTAFADTSAVVKLYADEPGSAAVRAHTVLVASAVTRVEVVAALWRKQRIGDLSASDTRLLIDAFLAEWTAAVDGGPDYIPVQVGHAVLSSAVSLGGVHGLRAYDAVQLGSAVVARAADPTIDSFLAADQALVRAAAAEGFDVPSVT
ncbi:MAG: uncharacterized protein QOJ60_911 [Actinomycetota bacterium]|nr:uncharacterized protein [Actinomycetota bacterium]